MTKTVGLLFIALLGVLVLFSPPPANAQVRFGVAVGAPPVYQYAPPPPVYAAPYPPYADSYYGAAPVPYYPPPVYVAPYYGYGYRGGAYYRGPSYYYRGGGGYYRGGSAYYRGGGHRR
jgi:hypothetical protein